MSSTVNKWRLVARQTVIKNDVLFLCVSKQVNGMERESEHAAVICCGTSTGHVTDGAAATVNTQPQTSCVTPLAVAPIPRLLSPTHRSLSQQTMRCSQSIVFPVAAFPCVTVCVLVWRTRSRQNKVTPFSVLFCALASYRALYCVYKLATAVLNVVW